MTNRYEEAQNIVMNMSMKRWRLLEIRNDASMEEILQSQSLMLPIMAHEMWRSEEAEAGKPPKNDFDRFEEMGVLALYDFLGVSEKKSDDDATKSGEPESADS